MTIKLDLPPETEARLRDRATTSGIDPEQFVFQAIEEKLAGGPTFAEILAPIHEETARQGGIDDAEVEAIIKESRDARRARRVDGRS